MSVLGAIWETTPSAPIAAVTAVIPSTSGTRCGDERAERDHEHEQRDRERDHLGPLEVVGDDLVDRGFERAVAGLLEVGGGVLRAGGADGRGDALGDVAGVVGVTAQARLDEHDAPAVRGELRRVGRALDGG